MNRHFLVEIVRFRENGFVDVTFVCSGDSEVLFVFRECVGKNVSREVLTRCGDLCCARTTRNRWMDRRRVSYWSCSKSRMCPKSRRRKPSLIRASDFPLFLPHVHAFTIRLFSTSRYLEASLRHNFRTRDVVKNLKFTLYFLAHSHFKFPAMQSLEQ